MSESRSHPALPTPRPVGEGIGQMRIDAPTRGNRRLEKLFAAANADDQLKAWWHVQQVNADRLVMSDHSWVHIRIVLNIALRILRLLVRRGGGGQVRSPHPQGPRAGQGGGAAPGQLHGAGGVVPRPPPEG